MPDTAYQITRRSGRRVTVSLQGTPVANPETLERTETRQVVNVRRVMVEPTKYTRLVRAKAAQQDVGETTFIFWLRDVPFRRVTPEDYAIVDGVRYNFVESSVEGTGLVASAREITGQVANQEIAADVSNETNLTQPTDSETT